MRSFVRPAVALALAALLSPPLPLSAQEAIAPPAPPSGPSLAPPYDEGLLRLSEILGAIHYLRKVCGTDEGRLWRDEMQALIDAEQPQPDRKARFVDRFNRGYESFRTVYRACTPAAEVAIDRYLQEGANIARDIAARYGKEK